MFTLRVPPPRLLRDRAGDTLMAVYHRALWGHWGPADRAIGLLLTACTGAARPSRWNGRWNALSQADLRLAGGATMLDDYVGMADRKGVHRLLNPAAFPLRTNLLKNKHLFAATCAAAGLPVPDTFAGTADALTGWLDRHAAVMVKPNYASKGAGIVRYDRGRAWSPAVVDKIAAAKGAIVQQALLTYPGLADLSPGALPTYRIMTILDERGAIEACDVLLRLSRGGGRPVDNFNAGNLVAGIGEDGRIGAAFGRVAPPRNGEGDHPQNIGGAFSTVAQAPPPLCERSPSPFRGGTEVACYDSHPLTGAVIAGIPAPLLAEARALAMTAHEQLGEGFTVIGWDIGITAQGVVLIEGNWNPGTDVLQLVSGQGLTATRLGRLYRHHLDSLPPDRWRQAKPLSRDRR